MVSLHIKSMNRGDQTGMEQQQNQYRPRLCTRNIGQAERIWRPTEDPKRTTEHSKLFSQLG